MDQRSPSRGRSRTSQESDRPAGRAPFATAAALTVFVGTSILAGPTSGVAPVPGFDSERLALSPGAAGSLVLGTGDVLPSGTLRVAVAAHYEKEPLILRANGQRVGAVIGDRWISPLLLAWAPGKRWELGFQVPVIVSQGGDDLTALGVSAPRGRGLGTPWLQVRWAWLREGRPHPIDLALQLGIGLPVGSQAALAGDDGWVRLAPQVSAGKRLGSWLRAGGELSLELRPKASLSGGTGRDEVGSLMKIGAGLQTVGAPLRGEVALRSLVSLSDAPPAGDLLIGARFPPVGIFEAFVIVTRGMGRLPGTPAFRLLVGVATAFETRQRTVDLVPEHEAGTGIEAGTPATEETP